MATVNPGFNCSRFNPPTPLLGPCPPRHVAVDLQCGSRTAVLSWEVRSDVDLYAASAIKESGGEVHECNSTGSTCQFSSLDCGQTYNFTVTAHSQDCYSQASSAVFIQTGTVEAKQVYLVLFGGESAFTQVLNLSIIFKILILL